MTGARICGICSDCQAFQRLVVSDNLAIKIKRLRVGCRELMPDESRAQSTVRQSQIERTLIDLASLRERD